MKNSRIFFEPQADIAFTSQELAVLRLCSEAHYDAVCKEASGPEGVITRTRNHHLNVGWTTPRRGFRFRDLDTLAKVVEVASHLDISKQKIAFGLGLSLKRVMHEMDEATPDAIPGVEDLVENGVRKGATNAKQATASQS